MFLNEVLCINKINGVIFVFLLPHFIYLLSGVSCKEKPVRGSEVWGLVGLFPQLEKLYDLADVTQTVCASVS